MLVQNATNFSLELFSVLLYEADETTLVETLLPDLFAYVVTVAAQPTGPSQTCTVTGGSGNIAGANVSNVTVACATETYTVGGSVSGLVGIGLVLQNNGGDDLVVSGDGAFTFATPLADGVTFRYYLLEDVVAGTATVTFQSEGWFDQDGNPGTAESESFRILDNTVPEDPGVAGDPADRPAEKPKARADRPAREALAALRSAMRHTEATCLLAGSDGAALPRISRVWRLDAGRVREERPGPLLAARGENSEVFPSGSVAVAVKVSSVCSSIISSCKAPSTGGRLTSPTETWSRTRTPSTTTCRPRWSSC